MTVFAIRAVVAAAMLASISTIGFAQVPADPFAEGEEEVGGMKAQFLAQQRQQKAAMQQQMEVRIADMRQACSLSASQTRKLQLAAKGAVSHSMETWSKQMRKAMGIPEEADDPEDKNPKVKERKQAPVAGLIINQVLAFRSFGFGGNATTTPHQQSLWKKTVKKVLTKDQQAALTKHLETRRAFRRRASVISFVSQMDSQLLLSADQRKELLVVVDKSIGGSLERGSSQMQMNNMNGVVMFSSNYRRRINKEKLKNILTESQLKKWNSKRNVNQQWFGGGGFGGGMVQMMDVQEEMVDDVAIEAVVEGARIELRAGNFARKEKGDKKDKDKAEEKIEKKIQKK